MSRYLDAPDIITGNASPLDPAVKQRLLRHLDSCVSELDLDLGSRPDSGLGSSPGSVTDRVPSASSPGPLDHHAGVNVGSAHCSASSLAAAGGGGAGGALIKAELPEIMETAARPDSSTTTAGDENNNSSRPTSAFSQVAQGLPSSEQASTSQQNGGPGMLSVVQVIPSRLPDGQVVFLLPSHYVQLAAAAAANGISIGPNPPTAIWAATNMSLLKATDKLIAKRPHEEPPEWPDAVKPSKSPRVDHLELQHEQPLDFTTSKKLSGVNGTQPPPAIEREERFREIMDDASSQSAHEIPTSRPPSEGIRAQPSPPPAVPPQPPKDEEGMWRPW